MLINHCTLYMTDRHCWLIIYVTLRIPYCVTCIPVSFGTPITTEGAPCRLIHYLQSQYPILELSLQSNWKNQRARELILALLNLLLRDAAPMIHGSFLYTIVKSWSSSCPFKYWNLRVNETHLSSRYPAIATRMS
jgi:hypothetical protein